jgi:hypothetical protein
MLSIFLRIVLSKVEYVDMASHESLRKDESIVNNGHKAQYPLYILPY